MIYRAFRTEYNSPAGNTGSEAVIDILEIEEHLVIQESNIFYRLTFNENAREASRN
jgi:hypothetical protein